MNTSFFFRSFSTVALASALVLSGCGSKTKTNETGDTNTAEFKLNLEKGKKFYTTMVMDQQIETSAMGSAMSINQSITFEFDVEVKDHKENGNHVISNTYKRMALTQSMPGMGAMGETVVDTKDPSKNKGMVASMMAESLNKLIDKTFEMEMDQYGKVVGTNMNQLMEEMGAPDDGGSIEGGDMSAYNVQFPNKPVKVGESWEGELVQKNKGMDMKVKSTYTLKAIKDGIAEVEMKSVISTDTTSNELFGKISGTQSGTSYIELKTGWSKEMKLTQDMTMEMGEGGQTVPMKMKSTITLTSK